MSEGTICLICRRYVAAEESVWRCRCENPQPSNDGRNVIGQEDYAESLKDFLEAWDKSK